MKTTAMVFPKADTYEVQTVTLDAPGPGDIVVKTLVTAISPGTERWVLRGKHIGTQFPCIPGYHRIGVVEECGSAVTAFRKGDLVYGSAGNRWKENIHCMFGAHIGMSVGSPDGYHFVSSSPLPDTELELLAFTIVSGVAMRGIRFIAPKPGDVMLIIGAGFIGLCAATIALFQGAKPVMLDVSGERIAFAKTLVPDVLDSSDAAIEEKLRALAPSGFDSIYDTVGHAGTTDKAVRLARYQGTLLLQAQYFDKERCAIDLDQIKIRELTVKTTCGIRDEDWRDTMSFIRERFLPISRLITHRLDADQPGLMEGYRLLHEGNPFNMGIVFRWK